MKDEREFREHVSVGEVYGPALHITDQASADEYFAKLIRHHMAAAPGVPRVEAERIERHNLREYASYYDAETWARVQRLFRCKDEASPH